MGLALSLHEISGILDLCTAFYICCVRFLKISKKIAETLIDRCRGLSDRARGSVEP